jgi:ATP-dependent DNA helicase RecG
LFTHHFLDESDIQWLASFKDCELSEDEAKTLVLLRELGQIDNEAYRLTHQLDTLTASPDISRGVLLSRFSLRFGNFHDF